jgi:hypothetical protein
MPICPVPRESYADPARLCLDEIRAFVRGEQFDLLGKVLPNILREYGQPSTSATRVLWQCGLSMSDIKHVLCLHGGRITTSAPWTNKERSSSQQHDSSLVDGVRSSRRKSLISQPPLPIMSQQGAVLLTAEESTRGSPCTADPTH